MPASPDDLLAAVEAMDDDQRAQLADALAPEVALGRRDMLKVLTLVGAGTLSAQAGVRAIEAGISPAQAADGVVSDVDTLQSGDGSAITLVNDLQDDAATPNTLVDESVPAWAAQVGTGSSPAPEVNNDDYHETVDTQSGSTGDIDLSSANIIEQTVTGNISFSFTNPSSSPAGNSFLLIVIQDGTGGHTLTWPSSVEWGGGSAPGLSTNANDKHILSFASPDGGTTWYGFVAAEDVS